MIDAKRLFVRRLRSEWRFQYRVWKMAVDWTVALYIVIPALAVAAYQYASWWRVAPGWAEGVPLPVWLAAVYVLTGFGGVRLFLEEADQLFLIRNASWMNRLKRSGIAYSLAVRTIGSAAAAAAAAPFLVRVHEYETGRLLLLGVLAVFAGTHSVLARRLLELTLPRFAGGGASVLAYAALGALFVAAAMPGAAWWQPLALAALLAGSTAWLAKVRLRLAGTFYRDAAYEYERRMRFAALLLAQVAPRPSKLLRRRTPLLFRGSRKLFRRRTPDRVLAETIVKSFFRSGTQLKLYIQFAFAVCFGIAAMPVAAKWLFALGISLLMAYWVKQYGKEVTASSFVKLFPWKDEDRLRAIGRATPLLFMPAFAPAGLLLGWTAYGLWAGLLLVPAGWLLGYALGRLFNSW
ncbi:ABC transporter permease [Paenibacillus flagellatus]|uniref:Uncharacterized protein n=1 Tax=Paenibacillus flagellatus TaxID=2211139 RepID=A0A2V5KQ42_9BACL|nr:ABC transporter permease [Paenibacillus flagellatus]PYI50716.1 hypothetical protein DLM86_28530 [Paenibacillus flagellatus]